MKKSDLITRVAATANLTKADAERAINATFGTITDTLQSGDDVRLVGFGTFTTTQRAATQGRNPRTGQPISIPASRTAKFRVGKQLKQAVNGR